MKLLSIILIFLFCELEAIYEGIENRGKKELAKILQGLWILDGLFIWILIPFHWLLVPIYLLFRILLFSRTWNIFANQKINYIGSGWYDRKIEPIVRVWAVYFAFMFLLAITICEYIKL